MTKEEKAKLKAKIAEEKTKLKEQLKDMRQSAKDAINYVRKNPAAAGQAILEKLTGIVISKELIVKMLKNLMSPTWVGTDEQLDVTVRSIVDRNPSMLVNKCKAELLELKKMILEIPKQVASLGEQAALMGAEIGMLCSQIADIPAACFGFAAPAAKPMIKTVISQITALRNRLKAVQNQAKHLVGFMLGLISKLIMCGMPVPAPLVVCFGVIDMLINFSL